MKQKWIFKHWILVIRHPLIVMLLPQLSVNPFAPFSSCVGYSHLKYLFIMAD